MNDLTPRDPAGIAPTRRRGAAPDLDRFLDLGQSATAAALAIPGNSGRPQFTIEPYWSRPHAIRRVEDHGRWIERQIGECAPVDLVRRALVLTKEAANGSPDRKVIAGAVTLLIGSRARQPENPQLFMRALEFDLLDLGFSPTAVVVALQRLRREAKFTPEIPEVLAACEAERGRLRAWLDHVERAARWRAGLEAERAEIPALMTKAEALPEERPPVGQRWGAAGR